MDKVLDSGKTLIKKPKNQYDAKHTLTCYALLALPIIGLLVFTLYPLGWAIRLSWFSYTGVPSETRFIGWDNFATLFADKNYWSSWLMTIEYALLKMPFEAIVSFVTAYFLCKEIRGTNFFRSIYYLPAIFSVAIIGLIFANIFDYFGVANGILMKLGLIKENIDWFSNKGTAMIALLFGGWWNSIGISILYFMAALSNVPKDLYESAEIDGASELTKMMKITLPMIAPVLQILLLLSINGCLHVNEYILVMTNGAPAGTTHTVMSYLTSKIVPGFGTVANIGYASCMSFVTSIIICVVALMYNRLSNKLQNIY